MAWLSNMDNKRTIKLVDMKDSKRDSRSSMSINEDIGIVNIPKNHMKVIKSHRKNKKIDYKTQVETKKYGKNIK